MIPIDYFQIKRADQIREFWLSTLLESFRNSPRKLVALDKYHDLDLMENWTGSGKENLSKTLPNFPSPVP